MPATSVICIPGDGDDVENACAADEIPRIVRQEVALARHHCGGDGAGVVADDFIDPERQRVAQAIDGGEEAQRQRRGIGRRHRLDAPERAADAADPREIGVAREVVAAGQSGARRRQQPRLEGDEISRREAGRSPRRESHAGRDHVARHRLILMAFPIYLEIALLGERKPWRLVFFTASLLLALMCSALFFMWQGSMTLKQKTARYPRCLLLCVARHRQGRRPWLSFKEEKKRSRP